MTSVTLRPAARVFPAKRALFAWVNIQFNQLDEDRKRLYGADRACAEWLLRNGASVKWLNERNFLTDYNKLPSENCKKYIQEVDASRSSIMDSGFNHFVGVKYCRKVTLHRCTYLGDESLRRIHALRDSLAHLQITACPEISEEGLLHLADMSKLRTLTMSKLPSVKEKKAVLIILEESLPKCKITFE